VERWYKCRGVNGFPERQPVRVGENKVKPLFDLAAVDRWHMSRTRTRPQQARPQQANSMETIPLFHVDLRGHPVDAEQSSYRGHPEVRGHEEVRGSYRSSVLDL
jgi:hypothetical protein